MALGIVLTVVGAMAAWMLISRAGGTTQAVAMRNAVQRGAVIDAGDVLLVDVPAGTPLSVVSGEKIDEVAGKTAQVDLAPDQLLTPDQYGPVLVPESGKVIVGVVPNQAPLQALRAGDSVRLVFTPPPSGELPETFQAWNATVVRTGTGGTGDQVQIDVEVAKTDADVVGAASATGRLTVILASLADK